MATLFISDLHLHPSRPDMTGIFLRFMDTEARGAEKLYILGDLFHQWIGDDAFIARYATEVAAIGGVSRSGVPVYYMHGNRDFLIGKDFLEATGITLLPDPTIIDLYGTPTVLTHGDALCTDDLQHMKARAEWLNPEKQAQILALPIPVREDLARRYWDESVHNKSVKSMEIMDVTQDGVDGILREHHVRQLIHGHTHRPAIHDFTLDGAPARRIVLSDWHDDHGSVLVCDATGCWLEELH